MCKSIKGGAEGLYTGKIGGKIPAKEISGQKDQKNAFLKPAENCEKWKKFQKNEKKVKKVFDIPKPYAYKADLCSALLRKKAKKNNAVGPD